MTWPDATRYARGGLVCSVDHLATSAGVAALRAGGSAADAAVAASAVLAVTTQHMCGMGGDLLALVHPGGGRDVRALLAVGRAGSGSDADRLRAEGHARMPFRGDLRTVTVPGCVDGWLALHATYGRLPLSTVLAQAVEYAVAGFPVSPLLAAAMPLVADVVGGDDYAKPVAPGGLLRRPLLGAALNEIGTDGRDAWYGGAFGRGLQALGKGLFSESDLARDQAEWTEPASLTVGGNRLMSTPAPTGGYLVLAGAAVAHEVGAYSAANGGDPHLLIEAARVTGYDRPSRLADGVAWESLLDADDLVGRAARISPDRAAELRVPVEGGGTIYLCAADSDGMVVSLSQSNASGFGAHLAVPEVGVFLHNRGIGFSLEPGHPAELRPGARPTHTLCPSMVVGSDGAATAIGTMGGDAQPQILLQLLAALDSGATPAAALDRPRWCLTGPNINGFDTWEPAPDGAVEPAVALEAAAPAEWETALLARGHRVTRSEPGRGFGHAHLVQQTTDGVLAGAADPRAGTGDAQGA